MTRPILAGMMFGVVSAASCAKYDDADPDRPVVLSEARMEIVAPMDAATRIEVVRDRKTGRLCYLNHNGGGSMWCESSASTLPDALEVRP